MRYALACVVILLFFAGDAAAQQTPTPILKKSKPVAADQSQDWKPVVRQQSNYSWRQFQGATQCEQTGNVLTCNNGYKRTIR